MITERFNLEHEPRDNTQYALVMIKPHALDQVLDPVIVEILDGGSEKYLDTPFINLKSEELAFLRSILSETKLIGEYFRNLSDPRYRPILDVFYAKESGQPYYDTILDEYTGQSVFLLLSSSAKIEDLHRALKILRGYQELLNPDNTILKPGSGIRGVFTYPGTFIKAENVNEDQVRKIVRNVIHVPDNAEETAMAIRLVLQGELSQVDNSLLRFLEKNAPLSLI